CEKPGCYSRRAPFAFRYTFYRFLTRLRKTRLLFSSLSIRLSIHLLPLPNGAAKNPAAILVALHSPFDTPFTAS
ncbi:MAG TPA: hypothetical protein VN736_04390, partial [Candidatus Limnocylindrales bacterium]|nr:hypothetical protein [Candidatus Limnocylindrales bacterium]